MPEFSSSSALVAARNSRSGAPSNLGPMSSRSSLMLLTVNGTAQSYWRRSGLLDARKSRAARPSAEMWWADSSATAQPRLWLTTSTLCPSRVEHERAVVARVVDRALARRAVVLVARRERGGGERAHRGVLGGGEREGEVRG